MIAEVQSKRTDKILVRTEKAWFVNKENVSSENAFSILQYIVIWLRAIVWEYEEKGWKKEEKREI